MKKIFIDGTDAVFGRLASYVAKQALEGNDIFVFNCDEVLITGNRDAVIEKYDIMRKKGGNARRGPYYPKLPYQFLKKAIKRMLPNHRWGIGKQALLKIKCYNNLPKEFEKEKLIQVAIGKSDKNIKLKELIERI
jgi:large subunit ribosomal protein L13